MKISRVLSIVGIVLGVSIWSSSAYSVDLNSQSPSIKTKIISCKVQFPPNKWELNVGKIKGCFGNLNEHDIQYFDLYTNPSPDGKSQKNKILWAKRNNVIKEELLSLFPNVRIVAKKMEKNTFFPQASFVVGVLKTPSTPFMHSQQQVIVLPTQPQQQITVQQLQGHQSQQQQFIYLQPSSQPPQPQTELQPQSCPAVSTLEKGEPVQKSTKVIPPPKQVEKVLQIAQQPQKCPACERIIERDKRTYDVKIWTGFEFIYVVGDFSNYVPQLFQGYVLGMSQALSHLDATNDLYISFISDFANATQSVTTASETLQSIYYLVNFQFLLGVEHYFENNSFSAYADAGPVVEQRAFLITAASGGVSGAVNNYHIYTSLAFGTNGGLSYSYKYSDKVGILARLNLNLLVGMPSQESIYSSTGVTIASVDSNPVLVSPSVSFGVRF